MSHCRTYAQSSFQQLHHPIVQIRVHWPPLVFACGLSLLNTLSLPLAALLVIFTRERRHHLHQHRVNSPPASCRLIRRLQAYVKIRLRKNYHRKTTYPPPANALRVRFYCKHGVVQTILQPRRAVGSPRQSSISFCAKF